MLTSTGEYAVRAMIHIAQQPPGQFVLARDIGSELSIPEHYLSNVLGELTRRGLLEAQRGRGGGFRLNESAGDVSIMDVLVAVSRGDRFERCILGHKECSDETACPMHATWNEHKSGMLELFKSTLIADLAQEDCSQLGKKKGS